MDGTSDPKVMQDNSLRARNNKSIENLREKLGNYSIQKIDCAKRGSKKQTRNKNAIGTGQSTKDQGVLDLFVNRSMIHNSILNKINKKQKKIIREHGINSSRPNTKERGGHPLAQACTPRIPSTKVSSKFTESGLQTFGSARDRELLFRMGIDR